MERVRVTSEPSAPITRVRVIPEPQSKIERVRASAPARVRPNHEPEPNTKNEHGIWTQGNVFMKMVDCEGECIPWPCTQTGFLKDHRTHTHVSHYGRVFKLMTKEESAIADAHIYHKMQECFPNSSWQRGVIPKRSPWLEKERARLLKEIGEDHE